MNEWINLKEWIYGKICDNINIYVIFGDIWLNVYFNLEFWIICILIVIIFKNWIRKLWKFNDMCLNVICWLFDLN